MRRLFIVLLFASMSVSGTAGQAPAAVDDDVIASIREEGLNRSQVMDHLTWLTDVYGPRLTGGPQILQASDWALGKFAEWGLPTRIARRSRSARAGPSSGSMPRWWSLRYSRSSASRLRGRRRRKAPSSRLSSGCRSMTEADFEKYRGKLAGQIVLTQPERAVPLLEGHVVHRMGAKPTSTEAATDPASQPAQRAAR